MDILDLPFWRHRWHTYEIWATVLTLRILEEYQPLPKVLDGRIPLDGYTGAVIADLNTQGYDSSCIAIQVETSYLNAGRKAIKPDLRICYSHDFLPSETAAIVEFKQRFKFSRQDIETVAKAYIEGAPRSGGALFINYDVSRAEFSLPEHAVLIEGVQPCNRQAISTFQKALISLLKSINFMPANIDTYVLLDVSSSMGDKYSVPSVQIALKVLIGMKNVKIFRFNDGLLSGGDLNESDLKILRTSGGTQLGRAILEMERVVGLPKKMLIITDGDHDHPTDILKRIAYVRECEPSAILESVEWIQNCRR